MTLLGVFVERLVGLSCIGVGVYLFVLLASTQTETECREMCLDNYRSVADWTPASFDYHIGPYATPTCRKVCRIADAVRRKMMEVAGCPVPMTSDEEEKEQARKMDSRRRFWPL